MLRFLPSFLIPRYFFEEDLCHRTAPTSKAFACPQLKLAVIERAGRHDGPIVQLPAPVCAINQAVMAMVDLHQRSTPRCLVHPHHGAAIVHAGCEQQPRICWVPLQPPHPAASAHLHIEGRIQHVLRRRRSQLLQQRLFASGQRLHALHGCMDMGNSSASALTQGEAAMRMSHVRSCSS